jgi:hypothetical protein
MKTNLKPVVKWIDGEKWKFVGGVATVPGTSMKVTLKELKEELDGREKGSVCRR